MKILLLAFTLAFCQAFINQDYGKIIEELSARVAESQVAKLLYYSVVLAFIWLIIDLYVTIG